MKKTIVTIIFGFALQTVLFADTIYVDPSITAGGEGTIDSPYKSWNDVLWKPGNTYLQKRGTTYKSTIKVDNTGLSYAWIVIGAYGDGAKPLITTNDQLGIEISDVSYIKIQDLRIETTGQDRYFKNSGIKGNRGSYNTFENLEIGPAAGHGIYVQDKNFVVVRRCYFHHAGTKDEWDSCDNIHLENCHDYLVEYCISHDCQQGAEYDASDGGNGYTTGTWRYNIGYDSEDNDAWSHFKMSGHHPKSSVLLLYNIAYGCNRGPGYALQEELTATAIGNVAYDCQYGFQQKHSENIIKNNIAMNCRIGLYIDGPNPKASDYNIWYNNDRFGIIQDGQEFHNIGEWRSYSGKDKNSLNVDPMFADPMNADFTLKPASPAIDNGEKLDTMYSSGLHPLSKWPDQVQHLDQNTNGNGWDIGAFVYTYVNSDFNKELTPYNIFPNPADDWISVNQISFNSKQASIDIINCSGQKVLSENHIQPATIHVSNLPPGLYYVNSGTHLIGKFIKK